MTQTELDDRSGAKPDVGADDPEPRWPAFVAVIAVGGLYTALPDVLTMGPRWAFPSVVLALLIPTVVSHHAGKHHLNILFGIAVDTVLTLGLIISVILLIGALPNWPHSASWGYGPSGLLGTVLVVLLILVLMGRV